MKLILTLLFTFLFSLGFSQVVVDTTQLNIISWNIQNFGRSKSESMDVMKYISTKVKDFDIVAVQEVSTSEFGQKAVARLDSLLDLTGTQWEYVVSDITTGPGPERYAYLYKKNRVKLKESSLEKTLQDKINREPFKAVFVFKGNEYYLFNEHLVPTDKNPAAEAVHLATLGETYKGKRIIFMGDLNLSQSDKGFDAAKKWSKPTLIGKKTSLKMKEGESGQRLNMEYDNFFISSNIILKSSDVINFFSEFKELKMARKVSDHCPIYCIIK
jgi:endonuclease/exonuclease/phosphatase family metal-dependent hydrolase